MRKLLPTDLVFDPTPAHWGFSFRTVALSPAADSCRGFQLFERCDLLLERAVLAAKHAQGRPSPPYANPAVYVDPFDRICRGLEKLEPLATTDSEEATKF